MLCGTLVALSCSKIEIKDIPLYWDAGSNGAVETHLVSDAMRDIPKETWDKQRFGYACISQDDFAWLRATLEKACSVSKIQCGKEEKKAMDAFFTRSERAAKSIKSKNPRSSH